MKKLGKLSINPEKVMRNEELVNLRGGYGKNRCGYGCNSDSDCDSPSVSLGCKFCNDIPGWPDLKSCQNSR